MSTSKVKESTIDKTSSLLTVPFILPNHFLDDITSQNRNTLPTPSSINSSSRRLYTPTHYTSSPNFSLEATLFPTNGALISMSQNKLSQPFLCSSSCCNKICQNIQNQTTSFSEVLYNPSNCKSIPTLNHLEGVSPAKTIGDSLTELASSTARQLEKVWDEVGYTLDERASQLTDLLDEFRRLCTEKVTYERTVADTFRETIVDVKEEMRKISRALHVDVDKSILKEDSNMTLQDRLDSLEVTLDPLRAAANSARNELRNSKDRLITAHVALGTELEEMWLDVESDLTKSRVEAFRLRVKEIEQIVSTRTLAVVQLLKDCKELLDLLRINVYDNHLDRKIVSSLIDGEDDNVMIRSTMESDNCTGIGSHSLDKLTKRVIELSAEKRRRKIVLANMGAEIGELWEKLHVSREDQQAFAESINGLGLDTIEKGEIELKRLYELKSTIMGKLISDARSKIRNLWEEIHLNEKEKTSFQGIDDLNFTDDLLVEHEKYIEALERRLRQLRPLLVTIEKRENIIRERMEYEELQKKPERLQQRGSALTKQLMKEEKMSRRIRKDLPRLTDELGKKLREWEEMSKSPFLYKGTSYLNIMDQQDEEWKLYKENQTQLKLKKKQQERIPLDNNRGRRCHEGSSYHKLLGRKKGEVISKSTFAYKSSKKPLSDETNHHSNHAKSSSCIIPKRKERIKEPYSSFPIGPKMRLLSSRNIEANSRV